MFDRSRYEPKRVIEASLRAIVARLDATLSPEDATGLVAWFARIERLAVAGKTIAAARVADSGTWQRSGERSAAEWLAKQAGSTVGDARSTLQTGAQLADAPATDAALRAGELSAKQAEAVASAAAADPDAEPRLLALARHQSLQKLRDEAARVRAAAEPDPAARHERIRKSRFWRRWTDPEGARCGTYRMTPEAAALLEAAAQPFIDAVIDRARATGEHEPFEAYAADGLVDLAASTMRPDDGDVDRGGPAPDGPMPSSPMPSSPTPRPPRGGRGRRRLRDRRELIGIVNLESLRRGTAEPGEVCEIAGVGPVPVEVAREVMGDALLRIVIRDGTDIRTVVHTGRLASALQETAVLVRSGGRCERPSCDLPISEIDHTDDWRRSHVTTLDDLAGLCATDHDRKTYFGHAYVRQPDGTIMWTRPDGMIERERPPP